MPFFFRTKNLFTCRRFCKFSKVSAKAPEIQDKDSFKSSIMACKLERDRRALGYINATPIVDKLCMILPQHKYIQYCIRKVGKCVLYIEKVYNVPNRYEYIGFQRYDSQRILISILAIFLFD